MTDSKKSSSASDAIKKITIKQFEWYEVETKVRELLTELLQPFTKKQTEDTVKLNQIRRTITTVSKKIEDHDFLLTGQNADKPSYVQMQDRKILEIEQKFMQLQLEQNRKIGDMQKIIEVYEGKITQMNQLEARVGEEVKERNSSFKEHKDYVNSQVELMGRRLDTHDTQFNNLKQSTRNSVTKIETKVMVLENKVGAAEDDIKRKTSELKRLSDQIILLNERIASVDLMAKQLDYRLKEREKDYKLSEKFMSKTMQIQNELTFIQNYLRFYQPLYTQMQISQTTNSFLKGTMKTRACLFEQKVYAHMHFQILAMEQDTLENRMSDYSNRIRRIINRNKKYLTKLKVEQTFKYGNNIYEIREVDEAYLDQLDQDSNKPSQVAVPEDEVARIVDLKWEKMLAKIETRIDEKTESYKVWIKELQEQNMLREIELDRRISESRGKVESVEADMHLYRADNAEIEKYVKDSLQNIGKQLKRSKQQLKDIVNFSSVINHIVIQDQIDRQGLALYALRSGPKSKEEATPEQAFPNIHLDEKCVSCQNGNASVIVNQAFKMACLAYNPSEIKVDDRSFTREQILEISTNILDKLKKKIDEPDHNAQRIAPLPSQRTSDHKSRSKSLVSKHLGHLKNESSTIEVPGSSRLRDTTYLLPVLGAAKRKSVLSTRQKINI